MRMFPRAGGLHPPLDANILHLWCMGEAAAATNARDLRGNRDLTHTASPGVIASPIGYNGRSLNGTTQSFASGVYASDMASLGTCTIVGCVRLSNSISGLCEFFCYGSNGGFLSFNIYFDTNRLMYFQWTNSVSGANDQVTTTYAFPKGRWVPWAWTRNGAGGAVKFYLDGGLAQTWTGQSNVKTTNVNAQYFLGIGRAGGNRVPCDLGSLAVYNRVMTDTEIENIFRNMRMLGFDTSLYMRTEVQDGGGNWQDLTAMRRIDFVRGVSIKDDVDQRMLTATIRAMRQHGNMTLQRYTDNVLNRLPLAAAPLATTYVEGSEMLRLNAPVRVSVDRRPLGSLFAQDAGTANWNNVYEGSVDSTDGSANNEIRIESRDIGGRMMDVFVPITTVRSNTAGTALETVMTAAISDAKGTAPPADYTNNWGLPNSGYYAGTFWDVNTPTSPGWNVRQFLLQPSALLDSLNKWTDQIGWTFRAQYDQNGAAWAMTLYAPARFQTWPNHVVDEDQVLEVNELKVAIEDVRNEVWVTFTPDSSLTAPFTVPTIASGTTTVAAGAFFYGPAGGYAAANTVDGHEANRVVFRVKSSDLDTSEQGQDSITKYGVRRMMVAEGASSQITDPAEVQAFAIAMLRDLQEPKLGMGMKLPCIPEFELNDMIKVRQNGRWFTTDQLLAIVTLNHNMDSRDLSTSVGLRGRPSGGSTRHLDSEARPGVAPVPTVDPSTTEVVAGQTQRARRQIHAALLKMTPGYLRGSPTGQTRNADFQSRSFGARPPDGWTMVAGTWATDADMDASVVEVGQQSLKLITSTAVLEGEYIPIRQNFDLLWEARVRTNGAGTTTFTVDVYWFKADFTASATASTAGSLVGFTANSTWYSRKSWVRVPADAAYCKIRVKRGGASGAVWVQEVRTDLLRSAFRVCRTADQTPTNNTINNKVQYTDDNALSLRGTYDVGSDFDAATNHEYVAPFNSWYEFTAQVRIDGTGTMSGYAQIRNNSTNGTDGTLLGECPAVLQSTIATTLCLQVTSGRVWLAEGDKVAVWVYPSDPSAAPKIIGGAAETWFSGRAMHVT